VGLGKTSKTFDNLVPAKQAKIIDTAVEEFSAKGYRGASINALVARLGIAKGSLFQYFGSKKGLFLFVFDHVIEKAKAHLRPVRDESGATDLFRRLEQSLLAGVAFIRQYPRYYTLYLTVMLESNVPFRTEILRSFRHYSVEYLLALLTTACERGEIREDIPLEQTAFWLDAMMDRFLQAQVTRHLDGGLGLHQADDEKIRQWTGALMKMIREGLAAHGRSKIDDVKQPILIVAACRFELDPLLKRVNRKKALRIGNRSGWQGLLGHRPVFLLVSGAGGTNAAQALTAAFESRINPALVIQTGCGGGFGEAGVKVGDVCVATCEFDVHLGLETGEKGVVKPLPFMVLPDLDGPNQFKVDGNAFSAVQTVKSACHHLKIGFHHGPFISVATITTENQTAVNYYQHYGAVVENMEGAATAQVCHHYQVPFGELRGVSNLVGRRERDQWELELAAARAAAAVGHFIRAMAPKAHPSKVQS